MKRKIALLLAVLFIFMGVNVSAVKMYALDGRVADVHPDDVEAWKKVCWYTQPVMKVYALDGREQVIAKSDYPAWNKVGWYDAPSMVVYAPDGRSQVIYKSAFPDWKKVGWYEKPVMYVYAPDGRNTIIYRSDYPAWNKVGWLDKTIDMIYSSTVQTLYNKWKNISSWAYPMYCYYDIDKDGTPELIFDNALDEASRSYFIYTYKNNSVKYIGKIDGGHGSLYTVPGKNGILFKWGQMGVEGASTYKIVNGSLQKTVILQNRESYPYVESWQLISGSTYIDMKYVVKPSWAY